MGKLNTRQHNLKNWLEDNFESGRYFTIEEICNAGIGYYLNTDPKSHDKCITLSHDVKKLNYATNVERYIPIIKDKKGSIKLCESKQELTDFVDKEFKRLENTYKYLNHLKGLEEVDGTVPCINLADRALSPEEVKEVHIYASEETRN